MYALLNQKLIVLELGVTREVATSTANWNKHVVPEDSYEPKPFYGSKLDKKTETFILVEMDEVRKIRNTLLFKSDWRATVDYPSADQSAWLEYRQKLRDLPQDYPDVIGFVFPDEPNADQ